MALGISLHVGLNRVDPAHYQGWDGELTACEFDANDMRAIAEGQGFEARSLLTKEATSDAVLAAIERAAGELDQGDLFLCTYSGHGGQVPDRNGEDEEDRSDETWVAYDRQIVDDDLGGSFADAIDATNVGAYLAEIAGRSRNTLVTATERARTFNASSPTSKAMPGIAR
jgi:hypothetical protein